MIRLKFMWGSWWVIFVGYFVFVDMVKSELGS